MASFGKKTRNPGWKPGDHWVQCQRTGMIIRSSDARLEWTGLIVAKEVWEPRHPQDLLRGRPDNFAAVGIVNPEAADVFIESGGRVAVAGLAVTGEAVAGTSLADLGYAVPSGTFNANTL